MRVAIERGAENILIAAALGGRLDQMLGNLLLLGRQEWRSANIRLIQDEQTAWVLRGPVRCDINGSPGDTVSILPLTKIVDGIYLHGVEWEVSNDAFSFGSTRPISNALTAASASVTIGSGVCLVIHIPKQ
jgi:thiamine pyrophosphokinase